jgi:hypothetical protein
MNQMLQSSGTRRVSRRLLVLLVVALIFGGYALWDYIAASAVAKVIDAARADHIRRNQEARSHVEPAPGATDAGPIYTAAAILASVGTPFGPTTTTNDRVVAAQRATQLQETWYLKGAIPEDMLANVRVDLQERSDALRLLDQATGRHFDGFARGTDYGARIVQLEHLGNLASARTLSETLAGRVDGAVSSAIAEFRLFGFDRPVPSEYRPRLLTTATNVLALLRTRQLSAEHLEQLARASPTRIETTSSRERSRRCGHLLSTGF